MKTSKLNVVPNPLPPNFPACCLPAFGRTWEHKYELGLHYVPSLSLNHRGRVSSLDARIRDSEDQLRRLQSSRTDQLQAFGPWMRSLVESLQRNRNHFRKMPKGPVGSMIRLKDYKWSTAVEQVLRTVLSCFIVDNPYDDAAFKRVASEVLRRAGGRGGRVDTIICSFQVRHYMM